ncbi:MAG TPA: alpha/beta hydrolase [Lachnospiraceae bacterium]|nr:alpha/beta hydrolase [Lachnospiraceae bacterium]
MKKEINLKYKNIIFLGEEDYMERIVDIVRPLLDKSRETGYFLSKDGTRLYYENYINPEERAAIVISHGFCEFTAKFEEVIFYFLQAGYSVYSFDYRGHGKSCRVVEDLSKVYVKSYEEYILDLNSFITQIVTTENEHRELILFAHSMGGAIGALYLERYPDVFTCAVLSSPMLEINLGKLPVSLTWLVMLFKKVTRKDKGYVPGHKAFNGTPKFARSSCLSEARYNLIFSKRVEEANYQTYGATYAWTFASMRAVRKLQRHAKLVTTPTLILQAGKDTTVRNGGQNRFAKKSINTTLVVVPDSKHEIFNGNSRMREEYFEKIFLFLDDVLCN